MLEFVLFFFGMPLAITLLYNYCEKQKKRKARLKRIEQERISEAKIAQIAEHQRELKRQHEQLVREQIELAKQQAREEMERKCEDERLREEQARQAKQIEKLEAEQRKMQFQLNQIAEDLPMFRDELDRLLGQVEDWQGRLHKAQEDLEFDELRMREAASAVREKEHTAHVKAKEQAENKVASLKKSIRKVEKQIATAEFNREEIKRKLSA